MDGMFYRREHDERLEDLAPAPKVWKLVAVTVAVAVAVVATLLLLSLAGAPLSMPDEFPALALGA